MTGTRQAGRATTGRDAQARRAPVRAPANGAARASEAVRAWHEEVEIPTYPPLPPDRNPMFLEKRVYQGSSGKVYPNPFTERVSDAVEPRTYDMVRLENEFVSLEILPELGGRIFAGRDRTNGYDFFYRQHVIKPALVGLLGPWISGGVEFNWPQHHRPSTFMAVDSAIEEDPDGGRTVWLSEHEPMNRMKGMVGITLHPGRSYVEARVRLYNRTPFVQTFLWWANVAVRVHDRYEAVFPPDVWYVADHAKRAMSDFPVAHGRYYGVDYGADPGGTDIRWYRNIPVPTSYMAMGSRHDWFGGYDHAAGAGLVHVADHRIAPGKKLWTWGSAEFGQAWDRELTDTDGPYVELMAGVYTDNQPDFSFLAPFETRTFSQFWYPIQRIGPPALANLDAAVNLTVGERTARAAVAVTGVFPAARVLLTDGSQPLLDQRVDLAPDAPLVEDVEIGADAPRESLRLQVIAADGRCLIDYAPESASTGEVPPPATEPPPPADVATADELYLTGLHLEQYRHATRSPEPYWQEAVRRDPGDTRSHTALGWWHLGRGEWPRAEEHFRRAIERLTFRNPNPRDGEPFYGLGLALRFAGRRDEAFDAFAKATWNYAWQSAANYAMAEIESARGNLAAALDRIDRSLATNAGHLLARDLRAALLRRSRRAAEALATAEETLALDRLDLWAWLERARAERALGRETDEPGFGDAATLLDVAIDQAAAGLLEEAIETASRALPDAETPANAMVHYFIAEWEDRRGNDDAAARQRSLARHASPDYVFPFRLEALAALGHAIEADPADPRAPYYLGNLLYDKRRYDPAIRAWASAAQLDPTFPTALRNLGIAEFNVRRHPARALAYYRRAFAADPDDPRLLYEWDQLEKRLGRSVASRLRRLERHRDLVERRDDLRVELATLMNRVGRYEEALDYLAARRFHPWEGGEGLVSGQYVLAHKRLAQRALAEDRAAEARDHLDAAMTYPPNLGEGKHLLTPEHDLWYLLGLARDRLGETDAAADAFERAAADAPLLSPMAYYRALALRRLGRAAEASRLLRDLRAAARRQSTAEVKIEYFATSLPSFLLFEDDLARRNLIDCTYLGGLADLGLGRRRVARNAFERVLALDPSREAAAWDLASSLDQRNDGA